MTTNGLLLIDLPSQDFSGTPSVILKPNKSGTLHIISSFLRVTTLFNSTGSGVAKLYTTANPANRTARVNAFAGTISTVDTGFTATGVGTAFTTEYVVGDYILTAGGVNRKIAKIASDTSLTVDTAWGATENGVAHSRGTRQIGTLTVSSTKFAVGNLVYFTVYPATASYSSPAELQPYPQAPYFNFVSGDTHTLTVTTSATTAGVGTASLALTLNEG